MTKRIQDPAKGVIYRALKDAFAAYDPQPSVNSRRKDGGYNVSLGYSAQGGRKVTKDDVYAALAERLHTKAEGGGHRKMTLEEAKRTIKVTYTVGISDPHFVGVTG